MDLVHVADLWEENQEFLRQRLGHTDSQLFGARWILMPEAPFPRFNHVSCIRVTAEQADDLIQASRAYYRGNGLPACSMLVTPATQPADFAARLYRMGFTSDMNPVMVWDGTPVRLRGSQVRVEYAPREQMALVFDMIRRVFFPSASETSLNMGRRGVTVSYDINAVNYIAYWGGRPAGAGMLFCRGGMAGIYNMCTLPEFRGHGVATAILAACLNDARAMGCEFVGLTPTTMGRPLYERLGFREVYQERYFVERFAEGPVG